MKEFKGTKEMYAVEFAGFFYINDEPYYEGRNVLDFDEEEGVSEDKARANAKLISAAPDLLSALQNLLIVAKNYEVGNHSTSIHEAYEIAEKAINKAL